VEVNNPDHNIRNNNNVSNTTEGTAFLVVRCSACLSEERVEESCIIDEGWMCSECRNFSDDYFKGTIAIPALFRSAEKVECILSVRVGSSGVGTTIDKSNDTNATGELEYLVKWKNCDWQSNSWVTQKHLKVSNQEDHLLHFLQSIVFRNLVQAALKDPEFQLCNVLPEHCTINPEELKSFGSSSSVQKIVYRCLNGKPFGVTQYVNAFTEDELKYFEKSCDSMGENEDKLLENTIDKTKDHSRTKYFVGYRYDYATRKQPFLHDDVDKLDTPTTNWMTELIQLLERRGIVPRDFLNCAVLNVYHRAGAGLGVHMDSISLFHRPIFSVRFFSKSVLSFGCRGPGMTDRKVAVPQPRGCITILEGFAANCTTHCIRPADVRKKTASIILRKVKPEMLVQLQNKEEEKEPSSLRSKDTPKKSPNNVSADNKKNKLRSSSKRTSPSNSERGDSTNARTTKKRSQDEPRSPSPSDSPTFSSSPSDSPSSPQPHATAVPENPNGSRPKRERKINNSLVNFPYIQW